MKGSEAHFNAIAPLPHLHNTPSKNKEAGEDVVSPPSHNNPSVSSSRKHQSCDELLMQRGSFSAEQLVLQQINIEGFPQRMRNMEQGDLQQLVKNVHRLERLLALNREQRKIENSRHEQDIKQLARELSLKEAEVIGLKEELEGLQLRAGQLLDECESISRERNQLQLKVKNEKTAAQQLQISYDALSVRVAQHCQQTQTIQNLRDELTKQRQQALREVEQAKSREDKLRQQVEELERQLCSSQQSNQELAGKVQELKEELETKEDIVKKYQQKWNEIEEKIDSIEEGGQFVHRISYSAHPREDDIRIEEENECHLRQILQQELEESFPSLEDHLYKNQYAKSHQEIVTATTLIDGRELELLQLLTQNLQREHGYLKHLYSQQQEIIMQKHVQLQNLEKSLQQMRYEFLLELSRVTALMNHQIIQNRALRQQNLQLQAKLHKQQQLMIKQQSFNRAGTKYQPLQKTIENSRIASASMQMGSVQGETCQSARCRQLQEDNRMLLKYNFQREQIYEMMITSRVESSEIIVQRFQNSFKYIMQHRERFASLLRNYGFDLRMKNVKHGSQIVEQGNRDNLSEIINNYSANRKDNYSEIQKFEVFQSENDNQLLLQSTAREQNPGPTTALNSIQSIISSIAQLYKERENMVTFNQNKQGNQIKPPKQRQKIVTQIQRLKLKLMKECAETGCKSIIPCLKQLERNIDQLCYT